MNPLTLRTEFSNLLLRFKRTFKVQQEIQGPEGLTNAPAVPGPNYTHYRYVGEVAAL